VFTEGDVTVLGSVRKDIDRYYKTEGALLKGPAQAWLDGDTIRIAPLN